MSDRKDGVIVNVVSVAGKRANPLGGVAYVAAKFGMGARSQRYSMIVNDGVVESLNVEEGGAFEVSGADYMLKQLG